MNWFKEIFGGGVKDLVLGIFDRIKGMTPEDRAKLQTLMEQNKTELDKLQLELDNKVEEGLQSEIEKAAELIKAETQSSGWLPRNVRPLLLLLWGLVITTPGAVAIWQMFTHQAFVVPVFDPWVYKLTAIGYTGYVTFRSVDKLFGGQGGSVQLSKNMKFESKGD